MKLKRVLFTLAATLGLLVPASVPALVGAAAPNTVDIDNKLCAGASFNPDGTCATANTAGASTDVQDIIASVINIFSLVVGVIAVIMIIIGGVKYITSGGDAGNVTGAKNTILYAIIGLVIVALAQTIVFFVLNQATGL